MLGKYLRQYRMQAFVLILFAGIYGVIFSLYDLETEAVAYGTALCALAGAVMLGVHFGSFLRKHREREALLAGIEFQYQTLPEPETLAEGDYQKMVRRLGEILRDRLTDWEKERQDSLDYYTTWVHQIKTPIAVMRMNLQGEDTEEHRELLAELFRIEQYAEMALSYIRLENSGNDLVIREYPLDDLIRQAIRRYASQFVRKRIRLVYEPTDVKVLTDEKWLVFILEQLLSNAIKYTAEGSITIRVTEDKKLSVEDTGIGIAPEDLPRIFEQGFTGYNGRLDKKATGLGLSLCKKAADKLGIGIRAESEPGKGSCFTLDLKERKLDIE